MPGSAYRAVAHTVVELGGCTVSQLGLRFDRVAVRVLDQLGGYADACAPEGACVILTLTAPIRALKQAVSAVQQEIATLLEADCSDSDRRVTFNEGRAKLCFVGRVSNGAPKLLGFIHNSSVDAAKISDLARAWLRTRA